MDLAGRAALVTGGAGHIGREICDALAELGAEVAVLDVARDQCEEEAKRVEARYGIGGYPIPVDLESEDETRAAAAEAIGSMGRLDVVVHAAALVGAANLPGWATSFADQDAGVWRRALDVNLTSAFVVTQECAPALARSGHGSVIAIGSIYGMLGPVPSLYEGTSMATPAAYAASKGGLLQLVRWLATHLAPDVRVNSISLGGVFRDQEERFVTRYVERTPLKRMATEADVKGAVAFLATDLSAYVTGHNLVVDGGWSQW